MNQRDPLGLLSALARGSESSVIRDLLEHAQRPGVISLAGGIPDPDLFPVAEIEDAIGRALGRGPAVLQYGITPGEIDSRLALGHLLGRAVDPAEVVVTTGSQQGLDLLAKVLIDTGGNVVVGDPSYLGALQAFRGREAHLCPVPVDEAGMIVEVLDERLAAGAPAPSFVYCVTNFDNPTGVTLSGPRRERLSALAQEYGFLVVEDDPYGLLRYDGIEPAPLGEGNPNVVRLRSTSKILAPGLRIGWMEGPKWLIDAVVIAKQSADLHTSTLSQAVATELLGEAQWFEGHVRTLCDQYRTRRDALCTALDAHLGDDVEFIRPDGGMFVWASIPGVDTSELLARALDAGVAFVPGRGFVVDAPRPHALRLSFATADAAELDEAARRLARAVTTKGADVR